MGSCSASGGGGGEGGEVRSSFGKNVAFDVICYFFMRGFDV